MTDETSGLTWSLARKLQTLEVRRDSLVRMLERSEGEELRGSHLESIERITAEIESYQQALEYNHWLDDELARGPWVEIVVTDVEEHDPMDGVHIDIVDEDPETEGVEVELVAVAGDGLDDTSANDPAGAERRGA